MSLKQPIEIRSVRTGRFIVHASAAKDVTTADFVSVPKAVKVVNNVVKAITVGQPGVDIRNINRALREPQAPAPEVTTIDALASTR